MNQNISPRQNTNSKKGSSSDPQQQTPTFEMSESKRLLDHQNQQQERLIQEQKQQKEQSDLMEVSIGKVSLMDSQSHGIKSMENPFCNPNISTFKLIFKTIGISIPNVLSFGSLWILNFANLQGTEMNKDQDYVSAYAMSFMWTNALGFALILSLNDGLCALCSQAIGQKRYNLVSSYYQRSQALNTALICIMTVVLMFTEKIFLLFTDPKIATLSQEFIYGYFPSLFFYIFFDSTRNLFNAHKRFQIPNLLLLFTYLIHFGWIYLFMKTLNLNMFGLGLSRSVTEFLNAFLIILIVKLGGFFKEVRLMWSKQAFKNWWVYLKLSLPMGSILYFEWIASDAQTLFVAAIKDSDQFAGHSAFVSIFLLYVVIPLGTGITIISYMGQAIGKGDIPQCKRIAKTAFFTAITISITTGVVSYFLKDPFIKLFTNTPGEAKYFELCYQIFNYSTVNFQAITIMMGSIMRAAGRQNAALVVPLISYFIIGIPLQYFMVFILEWHLAGSWISYTIGVAATSITFSIMVYRMDWEKQRKVIKGCPNHCEICDNNGDCTQCKGNKIPVNGLCECPEGNYEDIGEDSCIQCIENQVKLENGKCGCPDKTYLDINTNQCKQCGYKCATCKDKPDFCLSCEDPSNRLLTPDCECKEIMEDDGTSICQPCSVDNVCLRVFKKCCKECPVTEI